MNKMDKQSFRSMMMLFLLVMFFPVSGCKSSSAEEDFTLKEYFSMLPPDLLPEYISRDKCLEQLQLIDKYYEGWSDAGPIRVYDEENGYMSLSETEFDWVLMYRKLKDGRKMLLVHDVNEDGSDIRIFFYDKGELTEDTKYKPYADVVFTVEDLVDFSVLDADAVEAAKNLFNRNQYQLYYHLPQESDTIEVAARFFDYDDPDNEYVDAINFDAFKFGTLLWVDDKWIKE